MNAKKKSSKKFALIHIGTDEVYGLEFVAAELKRLGHHIRWFDGDLEAAADEVIDWQADFLCLSPLTTFLQPALELSRKVKSWRPETQSIFGGHHVTAVPETCELDGIDKIVVGPVYGTIEKIVEGVSNKVLKRSTCSRGHDDTVTQRILRGSTKYWQSSQKDHYDSLRLPL